MCWGRGSRTVVLGDLELQLVHRAALEIPGWMGSSSLCGSLHGLGSIPNFFIPLCKPEEAEASTVAGR